MAEHEHASSTGNASNGQANGDKSAVELLNMSHIRRRLSSVAQRQESSARNIRKLLDALPGEMSFAACCALMDIVESVYP